MAAAGGTDFWNWALNMVYRMTQACFIEPLILYRKKISNILIL